MFKIDKSQYYCIAVDTVKSIKKGHCPWMYVSWDQAERLIFLFFLNNTVLSGVVKFFNYVLILL